MSLLTKSLLFGALALSAAARGGKRGRNNNNQDGGSEVAAGAGNVAGRLRARFGGRAQPDESDQVQFIGAVETGSFFRGDRGDRGDRGGRGGRGRGGRGGHRGSGLIALEKLAACEDDILLACSLEFNFDMDELQAELTDFEAAREAAKGEMAAWLESSMEGDRPEKPELSSDLKDNLKAIRQCLHDVVEDTLSEDSECAAALTHPKPEDEVVEEPEPVEETAADSELAK